jgi:hypothetical protein
MVRVMLVALCAFLVAEALPAQAAPAAAAAPAALTRQVFAAESSFAATMAKSDSVAF